MSIETPKTLRYAFDSNGGGSRQRPVNPPDEKQQKIYNCRAVGTFETHDGKGDEICGLTTDECLIQVYKASLIKGKCALE